MRPEQIFENFPKLYHMAWENSWPSIKAYGLLSTKVLLQQYKVGEKHAHKYINKRRECCVEITCKGLSPAVLRDQKPMSDKTVRKALSGTAEPCQWYALLNSMVFFWPTIQRLRTMVKAKAYRNMRHDIIIVHTNELIKRYSEHVRISPINSGTTVPRSHQRDLNLFKRIDDFPFDQRKRHGIAKAIAEICVVDKVKDIADYATCKPSLSVDDIANLE